MMRNEFLLGAAALTAILLFSASAEGQFRDEPPRSAEEAQQRFRRAEFFLSELDANHNGILEAEECSGRRQFFVERMLGRAGLPVQFPIAIDRVREGLQRYYTNAVQNPPPGGGQPGWGGPGWGPPGGGPPGWGGPGWGPPGGGPPGWGPPGSSPPGGPGQPSQSSGGSSSPSPPTPPLVPGFGAPPALPTVPGFGLVASNAAGASGGSAVSIQGGGSNSGSADDQKYRDYAKQLFGQYDKNRNGVLERDEYSEMSNNPKAADRNGDGVISFDELFGWLVEMGKGGSSSGTSSGGHGGESRGRERERSKKDESKQPVYRIPFSTPLDRLPSGLPEWFLKKDVDRDGQVSMAEFTQDWSESKLSEYFKYDINSDGFITAAECIRVEKGPPKTETRSATGDHRGESRSTASEPRGDSRGESRPDSRSDSRSDARPEPRPDFRPDFRWGRPPERGDNGRGSERERERERGR